jgi:two-component system, cell cycle sensor histidine kinase and response regulator CckA
VLLYNGYQVLEAIDGAAGLVQFHRHGERIRAVITDSMMPDMDGCGMVTQLRELGSQVPIIAMTGLRDSMDAEVFKSLGVAEFIEKPFSNRDLLEALRRVLSAAKV